MLEAGEQVIDAGMPAAGTPPAAAAGDEPATAVDTGAAAAFAGPEAPHEYRFDQIGSGEYSVEDMQAEQGIRQALHAEGIPTGVASLGHMLLQQAVRNGLPSDGDIALAMRGGEAELARRHGDKAQAVIAQARQVFARLDKRNPAIGDILTDSGVANDPNFIEALARLAGVRAGR